jgi:hypothetical protein
MAGFFFLFGFEWLAFENEFAMLSFLFAGAMLVLRCAGCDCPCTPIRTRSNNQTQ